MDKKYINIPNTIENKIKVRQAVAEFMVQKVLPKDAIEQMAMDYLEETFRDAKHTIGDLARMVKETEIPPAHNGPYAPEQPNQMLCFGTMAGYQGDGPVYYFFTKEEDYEYMACEVKEITSEEEVR